MCTATLLHCTLKGADMFAAFERFIARWMAPLAQELARMPASAQRNILVGF